MYGRDDPIMFNIRPKDTHGVKLFDSSPEILMALSNKVFIEKRQAFRKHKGEIYKNINRQSNLPRLITEKDAEKMLAIGRFAGWVAFLLASAFLLYLLPLWIKLFSNDRFASRIELRHLMIATSACIGVMWLMRLDFLPKVESLLEQSPYTEKVYESLWKEGIVLEGTIVRLHRLPDRKVEIHYSFHSPQDEILEGFYLTRTPRRFREGAIVAVLYLDRNIHIVL